MKDRRNPLRRVTGIAESVAAGTRRRQRARMPRAVLYDADGRSRALVPGTPEHDLVVDAAERLVEAAGPAE